MKIQVYRYSSQSQTTLSSILIDGKFNCHGLEDRHRDIKVKGSTRIPSGTYNVTLRTEGGHHHRYKNKYDFHKGMLWVRDVPNFEWILIHVGNDPLKDSEGCLLVANEVNNNRTDKGYGTRSVKAYKDLYKKVVGSAEAGDLTIEYIDLDIPFGK
tara:strand:+ start:616 stop:1080 length:465 start_codon:yes stop_codon:yes gene_type:complete